MTITIEAIEGILKPVHEAVADSSNKDIKSSGLALHNFVHGAKSMSASLAQELQVMINEQTPSIASPMQDAILRAYQGALIDVVDNVKLFLDNIEQLDNKASPVLGLRCSVARGGLSEMTAARRNHSLRRRSGPRGHEGPV